MPEKLLPVNIYTAITASYPIERVSEIRVRADKPVKVSIDGAFETVTLEGHPLLAARGDIEYIIAVASENSVYAVNDAMKKSYLSYGGGVRIGLAGEGVLEQGRMCALKNITGLCIRIPHQVFGCLGKYAYIADKPENTLVISPPGAGKTTFLRELTRLASDKGCNTLVLDERKEIASVTDGAVCLDVGSSSDVLTGIPKKDAYENAVRSLNPEIVVTDEIFGAEEAAAVCDIARCGVKFFATIHAEEETAVEKNFPRLYEAARYVVVLDKRPRVGTIKRFLDKESRCFR